jgi:hypothetical protein
VRNRTASYQNKVDLHVVRLNNMVKETFYLSFGVFLKNYFGKKQFSMEPDRLLPRGSSK